MIDGQVDQHSLYVLVVGRAWLVVLIKLLVLKVHIGNSLLFFGLILTGCFAIIIMAIALEPCRKLSKVHHIARQCPRLVREYLVNLAKLLIQIARLG